MKKYVIKNCDCSVTTENICAAEERLCKDIDNCLLKNIVNKCQSCIDKGFVMSRYGCKVPASEGYDLASDILKLLDIEECE